MFRAGGPIIDELNSELIRLPPLSVPLRQRIVEKLTKENDGETKRISLLEGELFAVSAKANTDTLDLICFDVLTISESASSREFDFTYMMFYEKKITLLPDNCLLLVCSRRILILVPTRLEYVPVDPPKASELTTLSDIDSMRPLKRRRTTKVGDGSLECHHILEEAEHATLWLDTLLRR